ncbi:Uma2 family endonuclease [Thermocoleostomius sinensis]|uniref:Uma2 family endonuclease n=1 Tax=Thermocoleostomius sinensis A174 TaxID=2016057 RepID=A0A9E8ZCA5_9CYAN|nr:Uma2 family endonuclease [Thermocoleostomius sinensis]WAL58620.1 Uma2 family endonuclease [Thermocoleostomius sinensis A174]
MVQSSSKALTLQEYLTIPAGDVAYELVDGQAIAKVSPKFFHAGSQKILLRLLDDWCEQQQCGQVYPEWGITLKRNEVDWVPVPDLTYVSYDRLPDSWAEDAPCPVPPELAIEIILPDQTFGEMTEKATDYLSAGVSRVWVVDPRAKSITVFYPDAPPRTYTGETVLTDVLLPGLELTVRQAFR